MNYINKTTKNGKIVKLKNYKKRARINKLKRKLLLLTILFIILVIILLYAPFMQVKSINCSGNKAILTEDIIAASKICIGNNIFRINKSKAIDGIDDMSYIQSVKIDRKLPSTVNIIVEECQVSSYTLKNKEYVYLNDECKVLEISKEPPDGIVPLVDGIKLEKANVNETVEFKNQNQLNVLKTITKTISESKFKGLVTSIDISDTENSKFTVNNTLEIIIGNTENLDYKINFMASGAFDSLGSTRPGTLDVSYGSSAVFKDKQ